MQKKASIKDAVDAVKLNWHKIVILVKMVLAKMAGIVYVKRAAIRKNDVGQKWIKNA